LQALVTILLFGNFRHIITLCRYKTQLSGIVELIFGS
jgi:hypothetical protein